MSQEVTCWCPKCGYSHQSHQDSAGTLRITNGHLVADCLSCALQGLWVALLMDDTQRHRQHQQTWSEFFTG